MLVSRVSAKVQKQRQSNVVERCLSMSPPEVVWYCWPEKFDETYVSTSESYSASDSQVVQVADSLREWKTMIHLCSMRAVIQPKKHPPCYRVQDSFNFKFFQFYFFFEVSGDVWRMANEVMKYIDTNDANVCKNFCRKCLEIGFESL